MTIPSSPDEDPRNVLSRYLDGLVAGDVEVIADSFAGDATWSLHGDLPLAGVRRGRDYGQRAPPTSWLRRAGRAALRRLVRARDLVCSWTHGFTTRTRMV